MTTSIKESMFTFFFPSELTVFTVAPLLAFWACSVCLMNRTHNYDQYALDNDLQSIMARNQKREEFDDPLYGESVLDSVRKADSMIDLMLHGRPVQREH